LMYWRLMTLIECLCVWLRLTLHRNYKFCPILIPKHAYELKTLFQTQNA
jgi:hypothetical protein